MILFVNPRATRPKNRRFPLSLMGAIPGNAKPTVTGTASRFSWYYFPWETFIWLGPND